MKMFKMVKAVKITFWRLTINKTWPWTLLNAIFYLFIANKYSKNEVKVQVLEIIYVKKIETKNDSIKKYFLSVIVIVRNNYLRNLKCQKSRNVHKNCCNEQ